MFRPNNFTTMVVDWVFQGSGYLTVLAYVTKHSVMCAKNSESIDDLCLAMIVLRPWWLTGFSRVRVISLFRHTSPNTRRCVPKH